MGLTGVLVGRNTLEEALHETAVPGLRLLPAGPVPPNPTELLNSRAMRELHTQLKELADVVIFDSPPCLATADAQVLAAEADGVLYVVQFGFARRTAVQHAGDLLRQARARVIGVVCNKIDIRSQRDDHYMGYYKYYNSYTGNRMDEGKPSEGKNLEQLLTTGDESQPPADRQPIEPSRAKKRG